MSDCIICPLYWAENNGIRAEKACSGKKPRKDCTDRLLEYIGDLKASLQEKDFEINDLKWQWTERFPGFLISHHEWPRDVVWIINRFKTDAGETRFEVCYTLTDDKSIGSGDIWDNRVRVHDAFSMEGAKRWIFAHHEEYPQVYKKRGEKKENV